MFNNPMVKGIVMTIIRYLLAAALVSLTTRGVITAEQGEYLLSEPVIAGIVGFLGVVAWGIYARFRDRQKIVGGLSSPKGTTEAALEEKIAKGETPSVTLQKTESPH